MFTPMFAIARTVGWAAPWIEMGSDPTLRIARPRQVYTGAVERNVSALDKRRSLRRHTSPPYRRVLHLRVCRSGETTVTIHTGQDRKDVGRGERRAGHVER